VRRRRKWRAAIIAIGCLLLAAGALALVLIERGFDPRQSAAGSVLSGPACPSS
jgi:hypothetical protein